MRVLDLLELKSQEVVSCPTQGLETDLESSANAVRAEPSLQSACLSLAGIAGMHHHTRLPFSFLHYQAYPLPQRTANLFHG